MKLDEIEWDKDWGGTGKVKCFPEHKFDVWLNTDGTYNIWRFEQLVGQYSKLEYNKLDPLTAQAVLYHLLNRRS